MVLDEQGARSVHKHAMLYTDHETFAAIDLLRLFIDTDLCIQPSFLQRSNDFYTNTLLVQKDPCSHEKKGKESYVNRFLHCSCGKSAKLS